MTHDCKFLKCIPFFFCLQWCLSQVINAFDDVKFEAASVLAELHDQQQQSNLAKPILRKAIELSQHSIYWHCRLIFQLAVSNQNPFFFFCHLSFFIDSDLLCFPANPC